VLALRAMSKVHVPNLDDDAGGRASGRGSRGAAAASGQVVSEDRAEVPLITAGVFLGLMGDL
jgi:hypothetical protein